MRAHLGHVLGTQAQGSRCRKVALFWGLAIGDLDREMNWGENAQWVGGDGMVIGVGRTEGHLSLHTCRYGGCQVYNDVPLRLWLIWTLYETSALPIIKWIYSASLNLSFPS